MESWMLFDKERDSGEQKPSFDNDPLSRKIAHYLQAEILRNRLSPGEQLTEKQLAKTFGTSRAPIREAFRLLEQEGFVEVIPRRGAFVRKFTPKEVENVYRVRGALEQLALEMAFPQLMEGRLDELEQLLAQMSAAREKRDIKEYFRHNIEFHRVFLLAANNETLVEVYGKLSTPLLGLRMKSLSLEGSLDESFEEHRRILAALKKRDLSMAKKYLEAHLIRALEKLRNCISTEDTPNGLQGQYMEGER